MAPRVSVVIKSYNHEPFVAQAIESVLGQSCQDFEIVVTDDASTDGTADVIRSFADQRISLAVHARNRGISEAMNATLARARGEYIAILNSDDYALPDRLARQVSFLDARPDVDALFGMARSVDESGSHVANYVDFRQALALPDFSRASWLRQFFLRGNVLCAPTAMIRRAAYERVGRYDRRLTNLQDLDMWVRMIPDHNIHVLDEELSAFRVRDNHGNTSAPRRDTHLRSNFEYAQILRHYRGMDPQMLHAAFAGDLARHSIDPGLPLDTLLAELALAVDSPAHRLFALTTLFESAQTDTDFDRLRRLSGSVDLFGLQRFGELETRSAATINRLEAVQRRLAGSRSWRYTAPLRWLLNRVARRGAAT